MRSSFSPSRLFKRAPSPYGLVWVPASALALYLALVSAPNAYTRVYHSMLWADKARGYEHDHPTVDQEKLRLLGRASGSLALFASFEGFRRLLASALGVSKSDLRERAVDVRMREAQVELAKAGLPPDGRLTFRAVWTLLGPRATAATFASFGHAYGRQAACVPMAAMWAVVVAPMVQANAESLLAHRNPDPIPFGRDARKRQEEKRAEALAVRETKEREREREKGRERDDGGAQGFSWFGRKIGGAGEGEAASGPAKTAPTTFSASALLSRAGEGEGGGKEGEDPRERTPRR